VQSFDTLVQIIEDAKKDVERADRGNKAAGTRVRKAMQALKKQAQAVRADVLNMRAPAEAAPCCATEGEAASPSCTP